MLGSRDGGDGRGAVGEPGRVVGACLRFPCFRRVVDRHVSRILLLAFLEDGVTLQVCQLLLMHGLSKEQHVDARIDVGFHRLGESSSCAAALLQ